MDQEERDRFIYELRNSDAEFAREVEMALPHVLRWWQSELYDGTFPERLTKAFGAEVLITARERIFAEIRGKHAA